MPSSGRGTHRLTFTVIASIVVTAMWPTTAACAQAAAIIELMRAARAAAQLERAAVLSEEAASLLRSAAKGVVAGDRLAAGVLGASAGLLARAAGRAEDATILIAVHGDEVVAFSNIGRPAGGQNRPGDRDGRLFVAVGRQAISIFATDGP